MPTSQVTIHFPCPVERVWPTAADLFHTARRRNWQAFS